MVYISPGEISSKIKLHYPDRTVALFGPPGIGKSEQVRITAQNLAKELGLEFIEYSDRIQPDKLKNVFVFCDLRLYETNQEDFFIPRMTNGEVEYKYQKFVRILEKHPGILFIDEVTNTIRPDVQSILFKLLLDKKIGFIKLNPGVQVVCAGNPPEYSDIAQELVTPILNRVAVYNVKPPKVEEWINYEKSRGRKHTLLFSYLLRYRDDFIKIPKRGSTLESYPTPRSWSFLLELFNNNGHRVKEPDIIAFIGAEIGSKFYKFLEITVPELEEIINDLQELG